MSRTTFRDYIAVMLDTNVFDRLLDSNELLSRFPQNGFRYYATDIQYEQINNISEEKMERRNQLELIFSKIINNQIKPINSQWFNFSTNFCNTRFCSEEESMDFKSLHKGSKKHLADALILLTAKFNKMILISDDMVFPFNEAKKKGYRIYTLNQFLERFC